MMEAYDYSDLPFEEVIEVAQPARDLNHHPVYQVMFAFQNFPMASETAADVQFNLEFLDRGIAQYDLSLYMWEAGEKIEGVLEYSTELFESSTLKRMVAHFLELLQATVADASRGVHSLSLLTREDCRLLGAWNATEQDFQRNMRAVDLFELQAQKTPQTNAILCGDRTVCYSELAARVHSLALYLRNIGVRPGVLVGIFLERSERMLEAILAVHKAGGAYVSLDPAFPHSRREYIVQEAGLTVVLRKRNKKRSCPLAARPRGFRGRRLEPGNAGNSPGTTEGRRPGLRELHLRFYRQTKGVVVPHAAVTNFLESMRIEPGLSNTDVLLAVTTLSFDISVLELFLPLISGATVVIAERHSVSDGKALLTLLQKTGTTVMQATPVTWRLLLEAGWQKAKGLKALCGGEALSRDLAERILATGAELWNLYGPTETTVWSAVCRVESGTELPPIGLPIANTQFHVLDKAGLPLPIGIPGELWIGGEGLALGYLGKEEMTRERFVSETEGNLPQGTGRLYRTGDLVKRRSDGKLDFLGRLDQQVKIRGFRIELEEIEETIRSCPAVEQAAVVVREVLPGDKRLVAYVVGADIQFASLRERLAANLPAYMIPSDFISLNTLPLTPNGKLDRKALPEVGGKVERETIEYKAPQDDLETQLVAIWESLLKVKPISTKADFFEMGGHSLLAAQLFARIEKTLGINLPLATLFRASTVAGLAEEMRQKDRKTVWRIVEPMQPQGDLPPLFLIPGGEGNILLYRDLARSLGKDRPIYGLQCEGLFSETEHYLPTFETSRTATFRRSCRSNRKVHIISGILHGWNDRSRNGRQMQEQGRNVELVIFLETYNIRTLGKVATSPVYAAWNQILNLCFISEICFASIPWTSGAFSWKKPKRN
jgi:amino acid adenylation domain-containing protein